MSQVERIGVSIDKDLLDDFDIHIADKGYQNRSEAIRDLLREKLSQEQLQDADAVAVASIFLVYDHHTAHISNIFKGLAHHGSPLKTISSVHVYIDHSNCLEIIIVKGKASEIKKMGEEMISMRGVKHGYINLAAIKTTA